MHRARRLRLRPAVCPHREENPGAAEAIVVIARSSQEGIVINLDSIWSPVHPVRPAD